MHVAGSKRVYILEEVLEIPKVFVMVPTSFQDWALRLPFLVMGMLMICSRPYWVALSVKRYRIVLAFATVTNIDVPSSQILVTWPH